MPLNGQSVVAVLIQRILTDHLLGNQAVSVIIATKWVILPASVEAGDIRGPDLTVEIVEEVTEVALGLEAQEGDLLHDIGIIIEILKIEEVAKKGVDLEAQVMIEVMTEIKVDRIGNEEIIQEIKVDLLRKDIAEVLCHIRVMKKIEDKNHHKNVILKALNTHQEEKATTKFLMKRINGTREKF